MKTALGSFRQNVSETSAQELRKNCGLCSWPVPALVFGHVSSHHPHPCPAATARRRPKASGHALGLHNSQYQQSVLIQSAAEANLREADRLECEAWNAIMWAVRPCRPPAI